MNLVLCFTVDPFSKAATNISSGFLDGRQLAQAWIKTGYKRRLFLLGHSHYWASLDSGSWNLLCQAPGQNQESPFAFYNCQGDLERGRNTMLAFTASLCVSSLVALVSSHKLDGTQYGSKSSYFTVANQDASSLEVSFQENFKFLIMVFLFLRTMPAVNHWWCGCILGMDQGQIIDNFQQGKSLSKMIFFPNQESWRWRDLGNDHPATRA